MRRDRSNEPPLPEPLAYFLTWGTYGTWLPGDERGWTDYLHGWQMPDPIKNLEAEARMTENACRLDTEQRDAVNGQVAETSRIRGWELHAVNCRSNHVHIVLTADRPPKIVRTQLKAWCTRRLKELDAARQRAKGLSEERIVVRENWWAERGSQRFVNDQTGLEDCVYYVCDGQDQPN